MAKKRKPKVKVVYRAPKVPRVDEKKIVKEEISELESKRSKAGKGFGGFLRRVALNKAIYNKKSFITAQDKLRSVKAQTEYGKALVEKEKVKTQLQELKKKSQVNFQDLYKEL